MYVYAVYTKLNFDFSFVTGLHYNNNTLLGSFVVQRLTAKVYLQYLARIDTEVFYEVTCHEFSTVDYYTFANNSAQQSYNKSLSNWTTHRQEVVKQSTIFKAKYSCIYVYMCIYLFFNFYLYLFILFAFRFFSHLKHN